MNDRVEFDPLRVQRIYQVHKSQMPARQSGADQGQTRAPIYRAKRMNTALEIFGCDATPVRGFRGGQKTPKPFTFQARHVACDDQIQFGALRRKSALNPCERPHPRAKIWQALNGKIIVCRRISDERHISGDFLDRGGHIFYEEEMRGEAQTSFIVTHARTASAHKHVASHVHAQIVAFKPAISRYNLESKRLFRHFCCSRVMFCLWSCLSRAEGLMQLAATGIRPFHVSPHWTESGIRMRGI